MACCSLGGAAAGQLVGTCTVLIVLTVLAVLAVLAVPIMLYRMFLL